MVQSPPHMLNDCKPSRADTAPKNTSAPKCHQPQFLTPATSAGETPHEPVRQCPTLKYVVEKKEKGLKCMEPDANLVEMLPIRRPV